MKGIHNSTWRTNLVVIFILSLLSACGGGSSDPEPVIDSIPEAFSFESKEEQVLNTLIESNTVTISGINTAISIAISGGEYSVDGGQFTTSTGTISNQQIILMRVLSSTNYSSAESVTITIGNVSESFRVTTHGQLIRYANELSTDSAARFAQVSQPAKGRVIVSSDLTQLTYQALKSYDYLPEGETAQETIMVSLIGESDSQHELTFTINGQSSISACNDTNTIEVPSSEVNEPVIDIADLSCVRLDASNITGGGRWVTWTGDNGGARPNLLSTLGVDRTQSIITFMPPTPGSYSVSWCPESAACTASFYFNSLASNTQQELNLTLTTDNITAGEEAIITVIEDENKDTSSYTYRWIIHHWTGEYSKLIDVLTTDNQLRIQIPEENNNYEISVIVDDNIFQLEGGFISYASDIYGKIEVTASTIGNYKKLNDVAIIRDSNSTSIPPKIVVMIDGNPIRYQGDKDIVNFIDVNIGAELTFDWSETTDENGDSLAIYFNTITPQSESSRFTFTVEYDLYLSVCASDNFPWTRSENPCVIFDIRAE